MPYLNHSTQQVLREFLRHIRPCGIHGIIFGHCRLFVQSIGCLLVNGHLLLGKDLVSHSHQELLGGLLIHPIDGIQEQYYFLNNSDLGHEDAHLLLSFAALACSMPHHVEIPREQVKLFPNRLKLSVVELLIQASGPSCTLFREFLVLVQLGVRDYVVLYVDHLGHRGERCDLEHAIDGIDIGSHNTCILIQLRDPATAEGSAAID